MLEGEKRKIELCERVGKASVRPRDVYDKVHQVKYKTKRGCSKFIKL